MTERICNKQFNYDVESGNANLVCQPHKIDVDVVVGEFRMADS